MVEDEVYWLLYYGITALEGIMADRKFCLDIIDQQLWFLSVRCANY